MQATCRSTPGTRRILIPDYSRKLLSPNRERIDEPMKVFDALPLEADEIIAKI